MGVDANILYEKANYMSVEYSMGVEYAKLPHFSFDDLRIKGITIKHTDFFFIPETYVAFAKELTKAKLPSANIIVCTSHKNVFNDMGVREQWGFNSFFNEPSVNADSVITTDSSLAIFIGENTVNSNINVIPQTLFPMKRVEDVDKKPYIAILSTSLTDYKFVVNSFYNKYPHLGWIPFKQCVFSSVEEIEENVSKAMACVYIDNYGEFTLFPLQAMSVGTTVIGKIPELTPSWLKDGEDIAKNGFWCQNLLQITDIIANVVMANLDDTDMSEMFYHTTNTVKSFDANNELFVTMDKILTNRKNKFQLIKNKIQNESINNRPDSQI
jgi:hypothetical protein